MSSLVRLVAVVVTVVAAAPAFAQPGATPPPPPQQPPPPPQANGETQAGTVVIVTPQAPVVTGPVYTQGQAPGQMQPGQPGQPAQPPPQNEPWSNVSHINGTPVKVGERDDYLYSWKTTNVSADPIGLVFGYYDISVSHAVHNNVAIAAAASVLSDSGGESYNYQLTAPIYFRRVFSGPFLELGLSINNYGCRECGTQAGPEVLIGWHWTYDSGLNLSLAFGAQRNIGAHSDGSDDAFPAGYFRVGYAF